MFMSEVGGYILLRNVGCLQALHGVALQLPEHQILQNDLYFHLPFLAGTIQSRRNTAHISSLRPNTLLVTLL
jgi:hypothetical protein